MQTKAETYRARYPQLRIAPGVLEFVAHRISTNVRVLEGALTRLFAFADLIGSEISMDLTQECLSDILRATDRKVTMDQIIKKVCEHYNIRQTDITERPAVRAATCPAAPDGDVSVQDADDPFPARDRAQTGPPRSHYDPARRPQDRGVDGPDSQISEDAELLRRMLEA